MGWAARAKSGVGASECRGPELQTEIFKTNFPVTVKIRSSGYQTLECFIAHSHLRQCMGVLCTWVKLLTDLQILGRELHKKCVWRPGSARDLLGEL